MKKIEKFSLEEKMDELDRLTDKEANEILGGYRWNYNGGYGDVGYRNTIDITPRSNSGEVGVSFGF